jgi:hypothetical protein
MDYRYLAFILIVAAAVSIRFGTGPFRGIGGTLSKTECGRNQDINDYGLVCGDELSLNLKLTQGVFTTVPVTPRLQRARSIFWMNCEDRCVKDNFFAVLNVSQGTYINLTTVTKDHALSDSSVTKIPFSFSLGFPTEEHLVPLY